MICISAIHIPSKVILNVLFLFFVFLIHKLHNANIIGIINIHSVTTVKSEYSIPFVLYTKIKNPDVNPTEKPLSIIIKALKNDVG